MEWFNIIFFHIFKRYYKNGRYKNDIPWLTASGIIGVASSFYLFSFYLLGHLWVYGFVPHKINKNIIIPLGFFVTFLIVAWFVGKKRYLSIYNKFKDQYSKDRLTETLSWIFVIAPYILFISLILILKK